MNSEQNKTQTTKTIQKVEKIKSPFFYVPQAVKYPPFVNGDYLEEYITKRILSEQPQTGRKFIPAYWTNIQISHELFAQKFHSLQQALDKWVSENPSSSGYFAVVQHDDGIFFRLPPNTLIFGTSKGDVIIPLIYEDTTNQLESIPKLAWDDKQHMCSFVGSNTSNQVLPNCRQLMIDSLAGKPGYQILADDWKPEVGTNRQQRFIDVTQHSRFALAPRGYGRTSFRLFEVLKMGIIPIYLWNDEEWLPYKNPVHGETVDYSKFIISQRVTGPESFTELDKRLNSITPDEYKAMQAYYTSVADRFYLPYVYDYIVKCASIS
jgi:hypothetical protein